MAKSYSSRSSKNSKNTQFLPVGITTFFARRFYDLWAFSIFGFGAFLFVAIASYSSKDPSLNTGISSSAQRVVENWAGLYGAYSADLLVQTLGVASTLLPIILMIWGYFCFKRRPFTSFGLRASALLVLLLSAASFFARIPAYESWPLGAYLGGSAGGMIFNTLTGITQPYVGAFSHYFIAFVSFVIACATFGYASTISAEGWRNFGFAVLRTIFLIGLTIYQGIASFISWVRNNAGHAEEDDEQEEKEPGIFTEMVAWVKARFEREETEEDDEEEVVSVKKPVSKQPALKAAPAPKLKTIPVATADDEEEEEFEDDLFEEEEDEEEYRTPKGREVSNQNWSYPPLDLLQVPQASDNTLSEEELQAEATRLQEVLLDFGVKGDIVKVHPGPVVTLYEVEPAPGTKSSRVISLSDDIARSMEAVSVRAAVIPGKNAIGIEIPNPEKETVYLRELLAQKNYSTTKCRLPLVLGKDIGGQSVIADLAKMPHLLVAGTTGSGKSVAINTMILSLVYGLSPEKCRFIMIDPKMLELSIYDGIPHLLTPVVTEPGKAIVALKWAVREMEERYRSMSKLGVRNIEGYNMRIQQAIEKGEELTKRVQTGFDADTGKPVFEEQPIELKELPLIVIIVDEFADLMMVAGKDVEAAIQRLAQMARAAGLHLIMATQRPSVDVITGTIKANFPTRISFQVTSKIDSRTILGESGAESLLGMGDMLYMAAGGRIRRVHGPFASDDEVDKVVRFLKSQGTPDYISGVTEDSSGNGGDLFGEGGGNDGLDELYDHAVALVASEQKASTSFIQRKLQIGYNRAARIIEEMEKQGVVGKANHVGKREILIGER